MEVSAASFACSQPHCMGTRSPCPITGCRGPSKISASPIFRAQRSFLGSKLAARPSRRVQKLTYGSMVVRAEISYVMVKPDGVQRGLVGQIISRFETKGFKLKGLKMFQTPKSLAQEHYGELKDRPFYPKLVDYITSGPVVCMVWEGDGVVASARKLIGKTDPLEAEPGTIRGDFAVHKGRNVVHGSDSPENGIRETGLWFDPEELVEWTPTLEPWFVE